MKFLIILLTGLLLSNCGFGQDMMITKQGDSIDCKISKIEEGLLFFTSAERNSETQVPIDFLHKYLEDDVWNYIGPLQSQLTNGTTTNSQGLVTARIFESQAFSQIMVVYETGETEMIALNRIKAWGDGSGGRNTMMDNQKIISWFINEMLKKGYTVHQMSTTQATAVYTFIIFKKD